MGLRLKNPVLIPGKIVLIPVFLVPVFDVSKALWRDVWAYFPFWCQPFGFFRKFIVKKSLSRVTFAPPF